MLTLAYVKDYINETGSTLDDFLNGEITNAYDVIGDYLDCSIADDLITEKRLLWNDLNIYTNLKISSVSSVKIGSTSLTTTNTQTKIIIDSNETLDDSNIDIIYTTTKQKKINDLALYYVLYKFYKRQKQRNDMFMRTKNQPQPGWNIKNMDIDEFNRWFEMEVKQLLVDQIG